MVVKIMNYSIDPRITFSNKNNTIVVYKDFNFVFFTNCTFQWISKILSTKTFNKNDFPEIPQNFIDWLIKKGILCKMEVEQK